MSAPVFVDTNVFVYADDGADPGKRDRARELIRRVTLERSARISMQVLQEYFAAATRKLGLEPQAARRRVEVYSRLDLVRVEPGDLLAAIDLTRLHGFSVWDALILRAALVSGCRRLYTEDLQHGFRIESLEVSNPFG
jgi:predicted nucleic acid-binding protein